MGTRVPKGYYLVAGRMLWDNVNDIVQISRYPRRALAEEYRYDARRLSYNKLGRSWVSTTEQGHVELPASMEEVLKGLELAAGRDYLVWVGRAYHCPGDSLMVVKATGLLQRTLVLNKATTATPLPPATLAAFAALMPPKYCDEGFCPASTKVRASKARLHVKWKSLENRLGASKPLK